MILWAIVVAASVYKLYTGELLFAPCLKDLEVRQQEERAKKHFGEKEV